MTDEILEYGGKYWTLSGRRLSYMRDKTQDDRYFILTLFAIAKELENRGQYTPVEQIQLAVGLPVSYTHLCGDKVMQIKNHDDVNNGDIGYIRKIIRTGDETVSYTHLDVYKRQAA